MNAAEKVNLKRVIRGILQDKIRSEIVSLANTVRSIQRSANEETKSSAGDKYETGRAMAHLEVEKVAHLLAEKEKSLEVLSALSVEAVESGRPGALVWTSMGLFYIGVNGGEIITESGKVVCISAVAPLAVALREKTAGDSFVLMQKEHTVNDIV